MTMTEVINNPKRKMGHAFVLKQYCLHRDIKMNKVIVGLQYGDEGKGKIVDYFASDYDYVCRFQGGANAGHTLYYKGKKVILHLIPSGILHKGVKCVIGIGVVFDPVVFLKEIDQLIKVGFKKQDLINRIFIDECCHMVFPKHKFTDENLEKSHNLGTTKQGIGPCHADKMLRTGVRIKDCKNVIRQLKTIKAILPFVKYPKNLHKVKVLCEGAQSIMLDIHYGDYPYVTSSHTLPQYVPMGLRNAPKDFTNVGVFKAYVTKVSTQGFPTELHGAEAERLRELGKEYGSTTGRPRKVGWLDLVSLKEAIEIGNIDSLVMTKPDILKDMPVVKVCYKYRNGKPVYKIFKTWKKANFTDKRFYDFVVYIENKLNHSITYISNGPNRDDMA
jgi:adenylosuccinate synthase